MKKSLISFLMLGAICLSAAPAILAAEPTQTPEMQLRERLRATLLQLRSAETERATLQAAQTQSADEKKALTAKLDAITKDANANRLAAKEVENLTAQVARQDKEIAQLKEAMESYKQAAELARKKEAEKEAERAKRSEEAISRLEQLVADRQAKNLALYKTALEILQRYEKLGLGDVLMAREPFTGITRVKLENLVHDYQDKLQSERTTLEKKDLAPSQGKPATEPGPRPAIDAKANTDTGNKLPPKPGSSPAAMPNVNPQTEVGFVNCAKIKMRKCDWDGAIADCAKAIELNPNFAVAYGVRGEAKSAKGYLDGAIADCTKAIELRGDKTSVADVKTYYTRGNARKEKKDLDGAIADYTKAIELNPKFVVAYSARGEARKIKGDQAGADEDFAQTAKLKGAATNGGRN